MKEARREGRRAGASHRPLDLLHRLDHLQLSCRKIGSELTVFRQSGCQPRHSPIPEGLNGRQIGFYRLLVATKTGEIMFGVCLFLYSSQVVFLVLLVASTIRSVSRLTASNSVAITIRALANSLKRNPYARSGRT